MASAATVDTSYLSDASTPSGLIGTAAQSASSNATSTGYNPATSTAAGYTANNSTANTYDPTHWGTADNQTVAGQMTSLLSDNSPYMQLEIGRAHV